MRSLSKIGFPARGSSAIFARPMCRGENRKKSDAMNALVVVDAGICGFQTRIHADSEDSQYVTFPRARVFLDTELR